jgi:addiction module HigA family antidote
MPTKLDPITPGEILLKEFLEPMGISQNKLARDVDVPITRINDIIHGKRGITADTALRLSAYFGTIARVQEVVGACGNNATRRARWPNGRADDNVHIQDHKLHRLRPTGSTPLAMK